MKRKTDQNGLKAITAAGICRNACRNVVAGIARAKASVFAEWSDALKNQQHALRLALNEALVAEPNYKPVKGI